MKTYPRMYSECLKEHFADNRQMAFVSGPRQVGKTTVCAEFGSSYLNWDDQDAREIILGGPNTVAEFLGFNKLSDASIQCCRVPKS
jgi:predicted AAA+ superfamily ATPase